MYTKTGRVLLFPANTRWSSLQITYSRLLDLLEDVNKISQERGWGLIKKSDAAFMKEICDVVTLFRNFTDKLQQSKVPTISLLLPGLKMLIDYLEVVFFFNKSNFL